jgi:hypothetical protein
LKEPEKIGNKFMPEKIGNKLEPEKIGNKFVPEKIGNRFEPEKIGNYFNLKRSGTKNIDLSGKTYTMFRNFFTQINMFSSRSFQVQIC